MTKQVINVGTLPNDGTGDTLLSAMQKINANFTDLYTTSYSTNVVNTFNNRAGAVNLLSADITGALGYTPVNKAGDTFTGLVVMNNGFVSGQAGVFDSNVASIGALPSVPTGTMIRAINLDTTPSIITLDSFINAGGTMSSVVLRGSRGIGSAPANVQTADIIGQVGATGFGTTQFTTAVTGQVNFVAEGNFTNISNPTAISFQVTPSASVTPSEFMRLTSAGNLILSGTGAIQLPVGNTGQQPTPATGMLRFNTTTSRFEFYNGAGWINHVKVAGDTMTGTLTLPALVGTTGTATLDSFIIGSITPEAATVTTLTASSLSLTTTKLTVANGGTGLATLTAHNVLLGEGTSNVAFAAPSTAGQALISAGATSDPVFGFPTGTLINVQTFTSSGTYTPTVGANSAIIEASGGGGGGGGCPATSTTNVSIAGSGGGGAFGKVRATTLSSQTVTINTGGGGGAAGANPGTAGGSVSIGTWLACPGGAAGAAGAVQTTTNATFQAAAAQGGTVATSSGAGVTAIFLSGGEPSGIGSSTYNASTGASGQGGSSWYGSGGSPITAGAGQAATGKGSGGSGAFLGASASAAAGGAGTNGIIIVYEYA
jgi:hypothetical protein